MNPNPSDPGRHEVIAGIVRAFEVECESGGTPSIDDALSQVTMAANEASLGDWLLEELVLVEIRFRRERGESPTYQEYRARYPHADCLYRIFADAPRSGSTIETIARDATQRATPDESESVGPNATSTGTGEEDAGIDTRSDVGRAPKEIDRYRVDGVLGQGSFGTVYKGFDPELERNVAIKLLHRQDDSESEAMVAEARAVASLDHTNIVQVHDVGRSAKHGFYIITKFVDGETLDKRLVASPISDAAAATMLASIAEALHYAHKKGVVHRDIKPRNIMVDADDIPYVLDFGLALRDVDFGKRKLAFAGTPAYMSPEQARGEGHRVDGRSDIFSLGIIMYEVLAGRRPFDSRKQSELLDEIANLDPRPLRQIDDRIDPELERICLKALSKRASERYTTAKDMAGDLREYVREHGGEGSSDAPHRVDRTTRHHSPPVDTAVLTPRSTLSGDHLRVVPKGLRSFDQHDADFFLELLPGPRDRDGLPETIRFWKGKVEETDPNSTFSVGLIYGPSGCGKSSLVKAGLLPQLGKSVLPIYVEATADQTETRILSSLNRACPQLPSDLTLREALALLRRDTALRKGAKLLVIIDQFEQWLHAHRSEEQAEMVKALRQCDGANVQCIVMVRDDFWMAATRFMKELEIRLQEGTNSGAVDLFPIRHSRKVLAAFGRAHGAVGAQLSSEQDSFIRTAVESIAVDGQVICVRLALFAEMVKGKPWTPETLRLVGGASGVGESFLEETFSATSAPLEHRYHQKAARAVLRALSPTSGTDIKGHMKSYDELLAVSGYASRPQDFRDLITILDQDIRLITPTDPEGLEVDGADEDSVGGSVRERAEKYYQLAHDYLVPSLRNWLTKKQKETRSGRYQLRLTERAEGWKGKQDQRHLPSLLEFLGIRLWTRSTNWNDSERRMMRHARNRYMLFSAVSCMAIIAIGWGAFTQRRARLAEQSAARADAVVKRLMDADIKRVPAILRREIEPLRELVRPRLEARLESDAVDSDRYFHACLALMDDVPECYDRVEQRLFQLSPDSLEIVVDLVSRHRQSLVKEAWSHLEADEFGAERAKPGSSTVLAAASVIAQLSEPIDVSRLQASQQKTADHLVRSGQMVASKWAKQLQPIGPFLVGALRKPFLNQQSDYTAAQQQLASELIVEFARERPDLLATFLIDSDEEQFGPIYDALALKGDLAIAQLEQALSAAQELRWPEPELIPEQAAEVPPQLERTLTESLGILQPTFALCQSLPLARYEQLSRDLGKFGYRPDVCRPYVYSEDEIRVAAIWHRDGRAWQIANTNAEELMTNSEEFDAAGFNVVDVAGFAAKNSAGDLADNDSPAQVARFVSLWVKREANDDRTQGYYGVSSEQQQEEHQQLNQQGFTRQIRKQSFVVNGMQLHCGIRISSKREGDFSQSHGHLTLEQILMRVPSTRAIVDVQLLTPGVAGAGEQKLTVVSETRPRRSELVVDATVGMIASMAGQIEKERRPYAISVRRVDGRLQTAIAWHWPATDKRRAQSTAEQTAKIAIALYRLGQEDLMLETLKQSPNPRARSEIIHRLAVYDVDPRSLVDSLSKQDDPSVRGAMLLGLGEYKQDRLDEETRNAALNLCAIAVSNERHASPRAAATWLLRRWGQAEQIATIEEPLRIQHSDVASRDFANPGWFIDAQGLTMVVLDSKGLVPFGPFPDEMMIDDDRKLHYRPLNRRFAVSAYEVTRGQFERFMSEAETSFFTENVERVAPTPQNPIMSVNWYAAVHYCNWLSEKNGIPEDQWCYLPNDEGKYQSGVKTKPNYLQLKGYRLPSELEWEFACRGNTKTTYYFGSSNKLHPNYAWSSQNLRVKSAQVGLLKPNDFGLFDICGNLWEWCHDRHQSLRSLKYGVVLDEYVDAEPKIDGNSVILRGGGFENQMDVARPAKRFNTRVQFKGIAIGLRPVRTID